MSAQPEPQAGPWLTPAEVQELTGRQTWAAQSRTLARMGIAFRANGAGRPLVERALVLPATVAAAPAPKRAKPGPNWAALSRGGRS